MKGNEIVGVIDCADNYFIYGHLHNVEYSVSLEAQQRLLLKNAIVVENSMIETIE